MTEKELDALETAAKAATPGPWVIDPILNILSKDEIVYVDGDDSIGYVNNIKYIAAANPAAVLELIAALRQARAERDWLAEKNQDTPCELGMKCLHPDSSRKNKNHISSSPRGRQC